MDNTQQEPSPRRWIYEDFDELGPIVGCLRCRTRKRMPSQGADVGQAIAERCNFVAEHGGAACPNQVIGAGPAGQVRNPRREPEVDPAPLGLLLALAVAVACAFVIVAARTDLRAAHRVTAEVSARARR